MSRQKDELRIGSASNTKHANTREVTSEEKVKHRRKHKVAKSELQKVKNEKANDSTSNGADPKDILSEKLQHKQKIVELSQKFKHLLSEIFQLKQEFVELTQIKAVHLIVIQYQQIHIRICKSKLNAEDTDASYEYLDTLYDHLNHHSVNAFLAFALKHAPNIRKVGITAYKNNIKLIQADIKKANNPEVQSLTALGLAGVAASAATLLLTDKLFIPVILAAASTATIIAAEDIINSRAGAVVRQKIAYTGQFFHPTRREEFRNLCPEAAASQALRDVSLIATTVGVASYFLSDNPWFSGGMALIGAVGAITSNALVIDLPVIRKGASNLANLFSVFTQNKEVMEVAELNKSALPISSKR